jgi:hypothetical protein
MPECPKDLCEPKYLMLLYDQTCTVSSMVYYPSSAPSLIILLPVLHTRSQDGAPGASYPMLQSMFPETVDLSGHFEYY